MGVRGNQADIISDANGPHTNLTHVEAQACGVGDYQLLSVDQLELVARAHPTLLHSSLIYYALGVHCWM